MAAAVAAAVAACYSKLAKFSVLFPKREILFGGKVSDHFHGNLDL